MDRQLGQACSVSGLFGMGSAHHGFPNPCGYVGVGWVGQVQVEQ